MLTRHQRSGNIKEKNAPNLHLDSFSYERIPAIKTIYRQYFKYFNIQGIGPIGFLDPCLPAPYFTEEGYQTK